MPKVVGHDETIAKKISCRSCGAVNEYFPNEVRELWRGVDYGGSPDGAKGFNCANCHEAIITERW